jgi:HYPK UBA domain
MHYMMTLTQMTEFEITKIAAEKALRSNQGELVPTINQLLHAF